MCVTSADSNLLNFLRFFHVEKCFYWLVEREIIFDQIGLIRSKSLIIRPDRTAEVGTVTNQASAIFII